MCEVCGGLGYVGSDVPVGHPEFGRLRLCPVCGEERLRAQVVERMAAKRARLARYDQRDAGQTFATFEAGINPQVMEAFYVAQDYARNPAGWLVLTGTMGTGKTHLLMAILNAQGEDVPSLFHTAPDLLDMLRSGYGAQQDYDELLRLCKTVPLLALDDLGTEKATEWANEKLFQILNHRYQQRLPLVVSTNVPLRELEPRLFSRLSDDDLVTQVTLYAPDYRQRERAPGRVVEWRG